MLKSLIGVYDEVISARECVVKETSYDDASMFHERTNIHGTANADISYGLFYNDKAVAMMSFSKLVDNNNEYELSRFSVELGYYVIDAEKTLLMHFEQQHSPKSIVSYVDRRWSVGKMHKDLGFKFDHMTPPDYWYFKPNI